MHNWRDFFGRSNNGPKRKSSDKSIEFKKKGVSFLHSQVDGRTFSDVVKANSMRRVGIEAWIEIVWKGDDEEGGH